MNQDRGNTDDIMDDRGVVSGPDIARLHNNRTNGDGEQPQQHENHSNNSSDGEEVFGAPAVRRVHNEGGGFGTAPVVRPRGGHTDYRGDNVDVRPPHGSFGRGLSGGGGGRDECSKENLPPCQPHEIEFIVKDACSYSSAQPTRSPSRTVGNFRFRLLVFPSGTHSSQGNHVSAFIEADPQPSLDSRWIFSQVKYQITVVNWVDYRKSVTKTDTWTFSKEGIDRGWHDMVRTSELTQEHGWVDQHGSLAVRASCFVRQADSVNPSSDYDAKKETGYVGLKNHGATCYMNGLLQSLFHVGQFREIVYSIDCGEKEAEEEEMPDDDKSSLPLIQALQNVFYKLQTSDQAVTCRELMKSFGWDTVDAFTQHDAQELNRILCDRLEEQMKGTSMDGCIKKLFEGEMENYIQCCDIDYKSTRNETFYDVQLNIRGERGQELRTIEESLKDFTAEETLEGDNAYEAEGHGKQRAKKGIRFKKFPPVLNLQLKRFHFDLEKMDMVKLNTRFEFKTTLDLSSFAPGAGIYSLHAVVVHSGDVNSGHYYAHIKPTPESGWIKFDDDSVFPCSEYAAVEDNYGGSDLMVWNYFENHPRTLKNCTTPTRPRIQSAYMLVYVRTDMAHDILRVPDPRETNMRMVGRFEREVRVAEQRKEEKMEQQLKIKIRLVFEKDLMKMQGFWDHADLPHSQVLKMNRDQTVKELVGQVENLFAGEVPGSSWALFGLHYRSNPRQVRFGYLPLNSSLRSHIPTFNSPHFDINDPYLVVLAVAARGYDVQTFQWRPTKKEQKRDELGRWHDESVILLIVKYYCPSSRRIVTLGCYYAHNTESLSALTRPGDGFVQERLQRYVESKEVAPLPEDPNSYRWECWEEFSERDIQQRNTKRTLKTEQLWSGDVIIFQPSTKEDHEGDGERGGGSPEHNANTDENVDAAGAEAPHYPVNTVADLAAHMTNSIDVTVTLHDKHQPLAVDGVVANGQWGPSRPQSATKEKKDQSETERIEDAQLAQSPCQFNMPQEKEVKMDLRWYIHHMTSTIAKCFETEGSPVLPENIWLFHRAPSAYSDEPLNTHDTRSEQTTLKDIQKRDLCILTQKKTMAFHVVELPFSINSVYEQNKCAFCVRFYDSAVREVGNTIVLVPSSGTAQNVIAEAAKAIKPEWGMQKDAPFRLLEVTDCRLHKVYQSSTPVRSFLCWNKMNIFFHSLRMENDFDPGLQVPGSEVQGDPNRGMLLEFYHSDRNSGTPFGQPCLLPVTPGEKASSVKNKIKAKLSVPEGELKSWRFIRNSRGQKHIMKDDDDVCEVDSQGHTYTSQFEISMEHGHPNPSTNLARQSRYNKPLTIK